MSYIPQRSVYINTEMLFALFDLLGLQFAPRIRDLGEQQLYRMDRTKTYRHIEPLLKGTNPDYRRRINTQLNKGEALHALRQFLFFANQGYIRRHQPEDQANQASCLNLVTNAVVTACSGRQ